MEEFKLELFDGHAIIRDDVNVILIDTGSPITIHKEKSLGFCGKEYTCSTSQMGLNSKELSRLLGMEVTTLLGVDVMKNYRVLLDYTSEKVVFTEGELEGFGERMEFTQFMGIPIIELNVDGNVGRFFLDTGAKLSYLKEALTAKYKAVRTERDFYPNVGEFEVPVFDIEAKIGDEPLEVSFGTLPKLLQGLLNMADVDGIIGYDLFRNFKVGLNLENKYLDYALTGN